MSSHKPRHKPGHQPLPAYALCGEQGAAALDRLHCEATAERSRLHGWQIRPHRHGALFQLFVVQQARGGLGRGQHAGDRRRRGAA